MKPVKYLVLVHFASKLTRADLVAVAGATAAAIRENLDDAEAVLTSDTAAAMVGISAAPPAALFRSMAKRLRHGDNLSVVALADGIVTSHPGLAAWQRPVPAETKVQPPSPPR